MHDLTREVFSVKAVFMVAKLIENQYIVPDVHMYMVTSFKKFILVPNNNIILVFSLFDSSQMTLRFE